VTAWQIADWICADATDPQKVALGIKRKDKRDELRALQAKARVECHELHLCRLIATASKHQIVDVHPDPKVDAGVRAGTPIQISGPVAFNAWEAVVHDNGEERDPIDLFNLVLNYWTGIIYPNQIAV
jgi:hypothetical protein